MEFKFKPEHEELRNMVRKFGEKELAPTAAERDEKEIFDRSLMDKMGALGLL